MGSRFERPTQRPWWPRRRPPRSRSGRWSSSPSAASPWATYAVIVTGPLRDIFGASEILVRACPLILVALGIAISFRCGILNNPGELMTGSGTPQSERLPRAAWLDRLVPGTRLHSGLRLALVLSALVWVLLWRTTLGYRMRAAGAGRKAARYAGIDVERSLVVAMLFAGGFAGLAGAVEVAGVHHRAIEGISSGYGFAGIVVALFGALHPAGIVPASVFFGLLLVGADMTQRSVGVPANMVLVLQGGIILAIVSARAYLEDPYARQRAWRSLQRWGQARSAVSRPPLRIAGWARDRRPHAARHPGAGRPVLRGAPARRARGDSRWSTSGAGRPSASWAARCSSASRRRSSSRSRWAGSSSRTSSR